MNTKQTFHGIDASLEISLLEYGLIMSDQPNEDGSGTHFCVYKTAYGYGTGHFHEQEINDILEGNGWANEKDLSGFYDYIGVTDSEDYLKSSFVHKMYDMISYWGVDNICGVDYYPMTEQEAIHTYIEPK